MKKITTFTLLSLFVVYAHAGLLFNYSQLATKDLDQMAAIVQSKVKESNKSQGDKTIPLKEALQAVYSRPNEDGVLEKILAPIKTALEEQDSWEKSLKQLTKEAIGALKNPKAFKPVILVTYQVFLENIIAELKPRLSEKFEKELITQIKDANISLSKQAKEERILRMMKEAISPSEIAANALEQFANSTSTDQKK